MSTRLSSLLARYPVLAVCNRQVDAEVDLLAAAYKNGNKLLVCGNGGSAADSEHIVAELMKGFLKRRPISAADAAKLETAGGPAGKEIASRLQGTLAAISLPSQMSLLTATANDGNFDMVFAQQVYGLGKSGDVLLAISTSGRSKNICNAVIV